MAQSIDFKPQENEQSLDQDPTRITTDRIKTVTSDTQYPSRALCPTKVTVI